MSKILIVKPVAADVARVLGRMPADLCAGRALELMSNGARCMDIARAGDEAVHLFAVGPRRYAEVIIAQEFPLLYANDFTVAWLRALLARVEEGGALWVQRGGPLRGSGARLLKLDVLREAAPDLLVETPADDVWRITARPGRPAPPTRSMFAAMQGAYAEFCALFRELCARPDGHWLKVGQEESQFVYAMMGANQKSWLTEGVLQEHGRQGAVDILDIGGGFGHFAAEMAMKGHRVEVHDIDPAKCERLGPWVAAKAGVGAQVRFVETAMEKARIAPDSVDVVTIFGSLLYADRAQVTEILARAWRGLRPGGALLVHENPRDAVQPGAADYEYRFPAEELRGYLASAAGEPEYLSPFSGEAVSFAKAAGSVMVAVVRKPHG